MYQILNQLRAPIECPEEEVLKKALRMTRLPADTDAFIYRKSLDTRKDRFSFVYSVALRTDRQDATLNPFPSYEFPARSGNGKVVPVIGFGPAGMFCAWLLSRCGFRPLVIERGKPIEERIRDVENFWNGAELCPESNVQFGEGGAGTFSDGKLTTRINDPRCRKILETFVSLGAPDDILKAAKPHIGTDGLRNVVRNMRREILKQGGEIRFGTKLTGVGISDGNLHRIWLNGEPFDTDTAVLATGNGADDTYDMLLKSGLAAEPKPFSVGFRIEHSQDELNRRIYGKYYGSPYLGAADYTFSSVTDPTCGQAVYSFCMCPGGVVVNASSDPGRLVTNGMSFRARDGENANAAILASVSPDRISDGLSLRRKIEEAAYTVAQGLAPVTDLSHFLNRERPERLTGIRPTFRPDTVPYDINGLFPDPIASRLRDGLAKFRDRYLGDGQAVLTAPETRTSSPLRLLRNTQTLMSVNGIGIYPCGEGAGYAGGIMSSAVDGIRVAERIIASAGKPL